MNLMNLMNLTNYVYITSCQMKDLTKLECVQGVGQEDEKFRILHVLGNKTLTESLRTIESLSRFNGEPSSKDLEKI